MGIAIIVSFLTGVSIVIARTLNAVVSDKTSVFRGTLYNYITGLIVACLVMVMVQKSDMRGLTWVSSPKIWIYLGGIMGVGVVTLSNLTVTKISSFYMTLLLFIGQIFAGVVLDVWIERTLSPGILIGGILVAAGLIYNLMADKKDAEWGKEDEISMKMQNRTDRQDSE